MIVSCEMTSYHSSKHYWTIIRYVFVRINKTVLWCPQHANLSFFVCLFMIVRSLLLRGYAVLRSSFLCASNICCFFLVFFLSTSSCTTTGSGILIQPCRIPREICRDCHHTDLLFCQQMPFRTDHVTASSTVRSSRSIQHGRRRRRHQQGDAVL